MITHEILHTLGASDKYDLATLAPLYPAVMPSPIAIRCTRRYSPRSWPAGAPPMNTLRNAGIAGLVLVGDDTALEIRWMSE